MTKYSYKHTVKSTCKIILGIFNLLFKVTCRSRQPVMEDVVNEMLFPNVAIKIGNWAFIH